MKLRLKEKISAVKSFKVQGEDLLYVNELGLCFNGELIAANVDRSNYVRYKDHIVYINGQRTFINNVRIDKSVLADSLENDSALFSSDLDWDTLTLRYELLDVRNQSIIYDLGHLSIVKSVLREGQQLYVHSGEKLICITTNRPRLMWEQSFTPSIKKILNIFKNELFIACSDHLVLSLDVTNGEITRQWRELNGSSAELLLIPEPSNFVLDKVAAKLIGVFDTYYLEVNLISGDVTCINVIDKLSKYGISDFRPFSNNPFTDDHLFLTAHTHLPEHPNVDFSSVLALNRNTQEIDWIHVFKDTGLGTNVPQITSTHLFQLDVENNLFVFERLQI